MNVISSNIDAISYVERWGLHAFPVGISGHVSLHFFHAVTEELVSCIEVDCEVTCTKVSDFGIRVDGNEGVVAVGDQEPGYPLFTRSAEILELFIEHAKVLRKYTPDKKIFVLKFSNRVDLMEIT